MPQTQQPSRICAYRLPLAIAVAVTSLLVLASPHPQAQGERELAISASPPATEFSAVAIANNNVGAAAGRVIMRVTRWSSEEERRALVTTLLETGPQALLKELQRTKVTGTIRTPDTLAYDLHYAHQTAIGDGMRRVVLATDRPISFWEAANQPRTIDYPFTIVQMEIGTDGSGQGTLSYATRITAHGDTIELENYATQPVMLTQITSETVR